MNASVSLILTWLFYGFLSFFPFFYLKSKKKDKPARRDRDE